MEVSATSHNISIINSDWLSTGDKTFQDMTLLAKIRKIGVAHENDIVAKGHCEKDF